MRKAMTLRTTTAALACVMACALSRGPAVYAADREHQQMMADIRMLQEQSQQLAITLAALNDTLKTITTTITQRLDQQAEANRKTFADQKLLIDNVATDLRVIRERSDETNVRISSLDQEIEALRAAISSMQAGGVAPVDPTAPADPNAAPAAPPPNIAGLSPRRVFDQAQGDYFAGQYTLAIQGFEGFIRTFPNSDQADDAQLLICESYFNANKGNEAVAACNEVIKRYPNSNAVPDAYYKRGQAYEKLGNIDAARESWQALIKSHPDSAAAQLARQGLDRIAARKQ
jgi:tol-pal system protein YbgF